MKTFKSEEEYANYRLSEMKKEINKTHEILEAVAKRITVTDVSIDDMSIDELCDAYNFASMLNAELVRRFIPMTANLYEVLHKKEIEAEKAKRREEIRNEVIAELEAKKASKKRKPA